MELKLHGTWVLTEDETWVNLRHCDLIETVEAKNESRWWVHAWNAYQGPIEPHRLASFAKADEARAWMETLIGAVAEQG